MFERTIAGRRAAISWVLDTGNSAGALLGMVKWPLQGYISDLRRSGIKQDHFESPGDFTFTEFLPKRILGSGFIVLHW